MNMNIWDERFSCVVKISDNCANLNEFEFYIQGVFFTGPPPKKLKYGRPRLGEVTCI